MWCFLATGEASEKEQQGQKHENEEKGRHRIQMILLPVTVTSFSLHVATCSKAFDLLLF